jgi:hypothetical protein
MAHADDADEKKGKMWRTKANFTIDDDEEEETKKLASDKDIIHKKIQLWTNKEENEYAIRLLLDGDTRFESVGKEGYREFIVSTDPAERYTHPIAETDKLDLLENGWDYALRDFVDNYKKDHRGYQGHLHQHFHHIRECLLQVVVFLVLLCETRAMITENIPIKIIPSNLSPCIDAHIVMKSLEMKKKGKNMN